MDKSASILIVDDYLLIRTHVRQVLAELGFLNVFQADNGKSAQDLMRKQQIDIVVGDWGMPVMSGIELLKWMRTDHRYAGTPFMMLTAEANPQSVRTALQAGVNAYMIKPFTVHSFACKFMSMLGVQLETAPSPFARHGLSAPAPAPKAAPPAPAPASMSAPAAAAPVVLPESNVIGLDAPIGERVRKSTVLIVDDIPTNIEDVTVAYDKPEGVSCLGEPLLCYSLFNNVLKNAIEASPPAGRVSVNIAPGYGNLHVMVDNAGEVPQAARERFFEKYAESSKIGGNGLGTYSIRLMAEVQGGSVSMDTGHGRTRLTITLPCP